eukprot:370498_1
MSDFEEGEEAQYSIVIDNGTQNMCVGFAGDDEPRSIFATMVGRLTKDERSMMHCGYIRQTEPNQPLSNDVISLIEKFGSQKYLIGTEAANVSNRYKYYPIQQGIIRNWSDMEAIWHHTFYNELRTDPCEHAVFMTERALNPKENREKTIEILFETFNVPACYLANKNDMIAFASYRNGAVTIDCGYDSCVVGSRCEGYL